MSLSTSTSPAHIPIWLTLSTHKLVTLLVVIAFQQQGDCKGTQMKRGKRLFTAHTHPPLHVAQNICYGTHTQTNSIWLAIWQQHEVSTNNNELTFISPPLNPFLRTYSDRSPHGRMAGGGFGLLTNWVITRKVLSDETIVLSFGPQPHHLRRM